MCALQCSGYAAETKPCIISIGLTIHNAPVEIREQLAIPEAEWPRAIEELTAFPHIEEAAVLSTCNRMEMYVVGLSWHRGVREIEEWMSCMSGVPLEELRPYLFLKRDRDATWHLLRVASGLDSLVMGEGQILAQVKQVRRLVAKLRQMAPFSGGGLSNVVEPMLRTLPSGRANLLPHTLESSGSPCACLVLPELSIAARPAPSMYLSPYPEPPARLQVYKVGQECHGFGRHLNGLFKQAITAGKRVRNETSISTGSVSVSSAAAELSQLKIPTHNFDDARIAIIGAGKMSTLLVKHLASKGCKRITIVNRSLPRAEALRDDFPEVEFDIKLMSDMLSVCDNSDIIFAASSSEDILVTADHCRSFSAPPEIVGARRFVDISVPRNIATDVAEAEGNIVYNVDDLKEVVAVNKEARKQAAMEAEVLLHDEQLSFEAWRDSLETVPTIKALRQMAEDVRSCEMDKALKKLGEGLSKKEMRAVEDLSRGIVNKLLHGPMTALRCDGSDPDAVNETLTNMEALERMFDLAQNNLMAGRR